MAGKQTKWDGPLASATLDGFVGYQLRRVSNGFMADFVETFTPEALRPAQFAILSLIDENPGVSQSELSRVLAIKKANMVPLVIELERRGLMSRAPDPADGRAQLLALTDRGTALLGEWRARVAKHEDLLLRRLSAGDRAALLALLTKLR